MAERCPVPTGTCAGPGSDKAVSVNGRSGPTAIGILLKQLRSERGMSIRVLAERADLDQANISRLETGVATHPQIASLTRLAEALGVEPLDFYDAAGIDVERQLPSFPHYLRARYPWLAASQIAELEAQLEQYRTSAAPD